MTHAETHREPTGMEVAVIGMAGRFPGASNVREYWDNLLAGRESIRHLTDEELDALGVPPSVYRRPDYVRAVRSMDDMDLFDAGFFDVSPREAELLDPQHRMFLEQCWETLEDAGYDPDRYGGAVGVFAGSRMNAYMLGFLSHMLGPGAIQTQVANDKDYLATRVSYKLDLGGPSVTVQTACSTALVALHMACQSLIGGECDMALAGGMSGRTIEKGYPYREGDVGSPDGRIYAFDARAKGTIFGNGSGVVLLKRLEEALEDGDDVRAVILGSALSNDGSRKVGFTAPSVDGQARAVRAALSVSDVHPESISYVEAHGTGTPLGDPIEIEALTRAWREHTDRTGFCRIGSVKSNIGHLSSAAGAASLIKLILALQNRRIPPSINFERPNPEIDFDASPFRVVTEATDWEPPGGVRRAGVSAFGMGGTNAHVILEEAPAREPSEPPRRRWQLLPLSARSDAALRTATEHLAEHLETHPGISLADVAYTLDVGRRVHGRRRAVVAEGVEDAVRVLRETPRERTATNRASGQRSVAFLFPGQGAQHPNMTRELYETEPVYRDELDRIVESLQEPLGFDLLEVLFPEPGAEDEAAGKLAETAVTQPALFAVEHALARLWISWGVTPTALLGHSIGEYVAATLAGVFSAEEAAALVAERGRLMQSLPAGSMLSVPLPESRVRDRLAPELSVAVINAPGRCVVSGPTDAIEALERELRDEGTEARTLKTSHAFHSPMMEPILAAFVEAFGDLEPGEPQVPFVSNVTGTWITADEATDPGYWARHMRHTVRFADGVGTLLENDDRVLLEVGPGRTLTQLTRRHPEGRGRVVAASLPHPKDQGKTPETASLLQAFAELWTAGVDVDPDVLRGDERRCRVPLPTYPFERRSYWVDLPNLEEGAVATGPVGKERDLADWFYLPAWTPRALPQPPSEKALQASSWLLFLDEAGLGEAVAERLRRAGARVATVRAGDRFEELGDGDYRLAPAEPDGYGALLEALGEETPGRVLHFWSVGDAGSDDERLERGFWSLLWLGRALGRREAAVTLTAVSERLQRVPGGSGDADVEPVRAALLGPVRVLPREHPRIRTVSLDLADLARRASDGAAREEQVTAILGEALAAPEGPTVLAHRRDPLTRSRVGWRLSQEPTRLEAPEDDRLRVAEGDAVLITGGLGGLGLSFGRWLARRFHARLVLTSRSGLPPRETWDDVLAGDDPSLAARVAAVRELEAAGAEVLVGAADVTDAEAMARVVAEARERFGSIRGVVHAAGLPGGGLVQLKTREEAQAVLAPKVVGVRVLDQVFSDAPPEWTLLCSSTIALLGPAGQVDYCAANSVFDAWAWSRAGGDQVVTSVDWGAWEEVGMAADAGLTRRAEPEEDDGEAMDHALLRRLRFRDDGAVFSGDVAADTHWVLDEHRILGTPALPGTSHLEIAASACRRLTGSDAVVLEDVFFFSPLMVEEGDSRRLEAVLEEQGPGFGFRVRSRPAGGSESQEHARGRVAPLASAGDPPVLDPQALAAGLEPAPVPDMAEIGGGDGEKAESESKKLVRWGDHWQSLRDVWLGEGEGLARLELPEDFAGEVEGFLLHPALLDVATALASALHGESYLPLSYGRVEVRRRLPARLWSHLRQAGEPEAKETITVDLSLLDDDGREVVRIERFAMKRVGRAASRLARPADPKTATSAGPEVDVASEGILPAEGVEAFRRLLDRKLRFPQVVVSAKRLDRLMERVAEAAKARGAEDDRREIHERPDLDSEYEAPRNATEERLVEIWQVGLGLDRVGVHDNFFDLGGDSVIGIQIVSKAQEAGLHLAPDQLFEHQTVAELAAAVGGEVSPDAAEAEPVAEPVDESAAEVGEDELAKVMAQLEEAE